MSDLNYKVLYPGVHVYENLIPNLPEFLKGIEDFQPKEGIRAGLSDWKPWYVFGQQREVLPENELEEGDPAATYVKTINAIFNKTTAHYIENNNVDTTDFIFVPAHILYYNADDKAVPSDQLSMLYHTDFQQEKRDAPGMKFMVTCNIYLNDDYEGGEVCFSVGEDRFSYKPKAGDILVFPSTPPYYHGVKATTKGRKYFVRMFWRKTFEGTKEWLAGQAKYGEEKWAEMEKIREKSELPLYEKHHSYQESTLNNG